MTIIKGEHLKRPVENDPSTSSNRDTTRDMIGRQNRASTSILGTSKIHINFLQEKEKNKRAKNKHFLVLIIGSKKITV